MVELVLLWVVLLLALILMVMLVFHIFTSVPFVPSTKEVITTVLTQANIQPGDTVYDLGAGDARLLIAAKRMQPDCTVIGHEFLPGAYIQGLLRIWWSGQLVQLHLGSFHKAHLAKATVVFCYLIPKEMKRLEQKFANELQPGTRVFSSMFPLPTVKPTAVHKFKSGKRDRTLYEYLY